MIYTNYKICCQCSYSFCEVCTLCLVGLWVDMLTQKCNTFCVGSMLFTYHIFIVSHWVWHTVLLCTITITSCLWYQYVIFNFCQIRGTNTLPTCLFHMACSSCKVHSSTSIPLQFYLINLWESHSIQHNLCFSKSAYMVMEVGVIYFYLTGFKWNFCIFSQNSFGYL